MQCIKKLNCCHMRCHGSFKVTVQKECPTQDFYMFIDTGICVSIFAYIHVFLSTDLPIYPCVYVYVYIYMQIYVYTSLSTEAWHRTSCSFDSETSTEQADLEVGRGQTASGFARLFRGLGLIGFMGFGFVRLGVGLCGICFRIQSVISSSTPATFLLGPCARSCALWRHL